MHLNIQQLTMHPLNLYQLKNLPCLQSLMRAISVIMGLMYLAALSGCATRPTNEPPAWITNPPNQSGHVYGVGSARISQNDPVNAIHRASDQARVAMIQRLRVTMIGRLSQDSFSKREQGAETQVIQSLSQQVRSQIPELALDDIEIQSTYVDDKQQMAYALAHLDRQRASAKIRRAMNELELELEVYKSLGYTEDPIKNIQQLTPALERFHQLDRLGERLQIVSPTGGNVTLDADLYRIKARFYTQFDRLKVHLKPAGRMDQRLQSRLSAALSSKGFKIYPKMDEADLIIEYQIAFRQVKKGDMVFVFADGSTQITHNDQTPISSLVSEVKGASPYAELAETAAVKHLADKMGEDIIRVLLK